MKKYDFNMVKYMLTIEPPKLNASIPPIKLINPQNPACLTPPIKTKYLTAKQSTPRISITSIKILKIKNKTK